MNPAELTNKNLKIANEFADSINGIAEGMLLSGSNVWGANYAVNENSDVDLLAVFKDTGQLGLIIDKYVSRGLVDSIQKKRFDIFKKLYTDKKADTFSFRISYKNTWVGIDFFPIEVMKSITEFKTMETITIKEDSGVVDLRIINEFRSNPPKKDGYSVDCLTEKRKLAYYPKFKEIKDGESVISYISKTLVDGFNNKKNKTTYFFGVMSFFFAVEPLILIDKNNQLGDSIKIFQSNIKKTLNEQTPAYITRQERMSQESLNRIKNLFN